MDKGILKKLREINGFTQEEVAEKMEVTVNTIQNWERSNKVPKGDDLNRLLDLYEADNNTREKVILGMYNKKSECVCDEETDNFPHFLFEKNFPKTDQAVRNIILNKEEIDLFGYLFYLSKEVYTYKDIYSHLEYNVFNKFGGYFRTNNILKNIRLKTGFDTFNNTYKEYEPGSLAKFIYSYCFDHYDIDEFNFCTLSKDIIMRKAPLLPDMRSIGGVVTNDNYRKDILSHYDMFPTLHVLCSYAKETGYLGSNDAPAKELPEIVKIIYNNFIKKENTVTQFYTQCIDIFTEESQNEKYLSAKKQYLKDKAAYMEHPGLFHKAPDIVATEYNCFIKLTEIGEKFLEWYEI